MDKKEIPAKSRLFFAGLYLFTVIKWALIALVIGVLSGAVGSAFHHSVDRATLWRSEIPWLLYCLPLAGAAIAWIYKATRTEGQGANDVLDEIHIGQGLSLRLLPSIFFSTFLTHLCGGSSGREGAALQMGGVIGYHTARPFRLDDRDRRRNGGVLYGAVRDAYGGVRIRAYRRKRGALLYGGFVAVSGGVAVGLRLFAVVGCGADALHGLRAAAVRGHDAARDGAGGGLRVGVRTFLRNHPHSGTPLVKTRSQSMDARRVGRLDFDCPYPSVRDAGL